MKVKLLNENAKLPTRADLGSNGYDLYASEDVFIPVGETVAIPTGISIELDWEYFAAGMPVFKIEDRSSMALKGLRTGGGVVDFSYRGEVKIVMHNLNNESACRSVIYGGTSGYQIKKGDKVAQGLLYYTLNSKVEQIDGLSESERGDGGFGSSGI